MASEESGTGAPIGAVFAGRAPEPHQIAARVRDQQQPLRRSAETEVDEVLAGAGGCAGDDGGGDGAAAIVEEREAVGVERESL